MYHETEVQVPPVVDDPNMVPRSQLVDLRSINSQLADHIHELQQSLDEARETYAVSQRALQSLRTEFDDFKRRITERMHREADRRDWCSEYDDIMEEMGLPRRNRGWDVEVRVEATFNRSITAADADRAEQLVLEEFPLSEGLYYNFRGADIYINEITTEVTQDN